MFSLLQECGTVDDGADRGNFKVFFLSSTFNGLLSFHASKLLNGYVKDANVRVSYMNAIRVTFSI